MRTFGVSAMLLLLFSTAPGASVYLVNPDGSGNFATIQSALDAATDGDTILLGDGLFTGSGNRSLNYLGKAVVVRSQSSNAATCIIDCEGISRAFHFRSGETDASVLAYVTIMNGYAADAGSAILCWQASPTLVGCRFLNNIAGHRGGALSTYASTMRIEDCHFVGNSTGHNGGAGSFYNYSCIDMTSCTFEANTAGLGGGGALIFTSSSTAVLTGCTFLGNATGERGGAVQMGEGTHRLIGCAFSGNSAEIGGGAVAVFFGTLEISGCTFSNNHAPQGGAVDLVGSCALLNSTFYGNAAGMGGHLFSNWVTALSMANVILAFSPKGEAFWGDLPPDRSISCCDIFGNAGGDWTGALASHLGVNGNIALDPQFCDPAAGDLRLWSESPCLPHSPPNEDCDQIGAWPCGCASTPSAHLSWGRVKTCFAPRGLKTEAP